MKNVQVIDGALNCTYDIFSMPNDEFVIMFPNGTDIEFVDDFLDRAGPKQCEKILSGMWERRQDKKTISGLHGTLFYGLEHKKEYYPTKREDEMVLILK